MKKMLLAALAAFLILAGTSAFAKEKAATADKQILKYPPTKMGAQYLIVSATGGFSSKITDYRIFCDSKPNESVCQTASDNSSYYDIFITGPLPEGMGINYQKPKKLELIFRSKRIDNGSETTWSTGRWAGCIAVRDQFICSVPMSKDLMNTGEFNLQGGGSLTDVNVIVALHSKNKEYETYPILTKQTVDSILEGPHSPALLIYDLDRDGTPDKLCGRVEIPSPVQCLTR